MESHTHHLHLLQIILWVFLVLGVANLFVLDLKTLGMSSVEKQTSYITTAEQNSDNTAIHLPIDLTPTVIPLISSPTLIPTSVPVQGSSLQLREFFIPFGSGINDTDDWADVAALQATIDGNQYTTIKKVVFEASVHIPNGNEQAFVRLFNITDKHPVWFSDVSIEGGTPQFLVSQPITLDPGVKTYQVQMKTSLKSQAILDQARLHIMIN